MSEPKLLKIPEVAAALGVSRNTVYVYIAAGEFPSVNIAQPGQRPRTRVRASDLSAWIEARTGQVSA